MPYYKAIELRDQLLQALAYRRVPWRDIPRFAPHLQLDIYKEDAISTAIRSIGYSRRTAKRKGFSKDKEVKRYRVLFAEEAIQQSREHLFLQMFSDEVQAFGGAFTQSYITILVEGEQEDCHVERVPKLLW